MNSRFLAAAVVAIAAAAAPQIALAKSAFQPFDWSGFYFGGNVGYGGANADVAPVYIYDDAAGTILHGGVPPFSFDMEGMTGGAEAGSWWDGKGLLFGVQADINGANVTGSAYNSFAKFTINATLRWLATQRFQVGVPVNDRLLLFGSVGLAEGGVEARLHDIYRKGPIDTSSTSLNVGYALGAGAAVALTDHWIAKAERAVTRGPAAFDLEQRRPGAGARIWPGRRGARQRKQSR